MTKSGLSKSTRKFIRLEKARIRHEIFDVKKQEELIAGLYQKFVAVPVTVAVGKEVREEKVVSKTPLRKKESKPKTNTATKKTKKAHEKK